MTTRNISRGALVRIHANLGTIWGGTFDARIVEIKDGTVTFAKTRKARGYRWSLSFDYVKKHGELLEAGEAGPRPGARRKGSA